MTLIRSLILGAAALLLCGASGDPGILLELDRESFELRARDLRDGAEGPVLSVVLGSPGHPTPSGSYPLWTVVHEPAWAPGPIARARGAEAHPPGPNGPLGIAKIPFAADYSLHGGARPLLLGKPVSLGCVRATDDDLETLLGWLDTRRALGSPAPAAHGEALQRFLRPARLRVR